MIIKLFLASLVFDGAWVYFFMNFFKPWVVGMSQSGEIGFGTFAFISLLGSMMPLAFIVSILLTYCYFDNRTPFKLDYDKNNKKVLVPSKSH